MLSRAICMPCNETKQAIVQKIKFLRFATLYIFLSIWLTFLDSLIKEVILNSGS